MISLDALVQDRVELGCPVVTEDSVYWVEDARLMVAVDGTDPVAAMPDGPDVRCDLYGYGAVPYAVSGSTIYFVGATDQALYRYDRGRVIPLSATRLDAGPATRFGAPAPDPHDRWVYCVREREYGTTTVHDLVRVAADGSGELTVVAAGHDFYGAPVVDPRSSRLAFITWDFPHMPWDRSMLWEASPTATGDGYTIDVVAGGPQESITQPAYDPEGRLHFVSDRTGWWNLYARDRSGAIRCRARRDAEYGRPEWFGGRRTYDFAGAAGIVAVECRTGRDQLVRVLDGAVEPVPAPFDAIEFVAASDDGRLAVVGAAPDRRPAVVRLRPGTSETHTLRSAGPDRPDPSSVSRPRRLLIRGEDGGTVHALFHPPAGPAPDGAAGAPPVVVWCHGGPTVLAGMGWDVEIQFWTSRGYAVVAVNYRGSPGFGRAYRQSIHGRWGVVDVADCLAAVRHLVGAGTVDPARVVVRGRSSGGLTALLMAARAGRSGVRIAAVIAVSGVTDPADLPERTHKMESRYLDGLIGPWPEARARYRSRSVFAHLSTLTSPVLLLHGTHDRVVPVEQARRLHRALVERGVDANLVTFAGEGHQIRQPDDIRRMARAELEFLNRVLGGPAAVGASFVASAEEQ